jgi:hypothetical protein
MAAWGQPWPPSPGVSIQRSPPGSAYDQAADHREGRQPEYAVIPVAEWRRIEAMLDELEDIRALDAALARPDRRMIPFEVTFRHPRRRACDPRLA